MSSRTVTHCHLTYRWWKDLCLWTKIINFLKWPYYQKWYADAIIIKIPMTLFTEVVKVHMDKHKIQNSQNKPQQKQQCSRHCHVWCQNVIEPQTLRQQNRIEDTEPNPCCDCHLILAKVPKPNFGEDSVFKKWFWGNWISICKRSDRYILPRQKSFQNRSEI